ncbi:transposon Ty3-G gag-pol polyprotein, partial [Trifolium medium]|nr:transposon Ty3-G gag-pol polyprotein [Trifolium medium]
KSTKPYTPSSSNTSPSPSIPPKTPTASPAKVQFRKLSPEEMASRREKNLCYNCDKTFTPQHRCKGRFFMLVSEEDLEVPDLNLDPPSVEPVPAPAEDFIPATDAQLSLHAMSGSITQNTFRILGTIAKKQVTILVDSGSKHNFIQDRVAKFLGLAITPASQPFRVMVGNGSTLECVTQCAGVTFAIQEEVGTTFYH